MKTIKSINHEGISYLDELGISHFVDFKKCNENWIQYRKRTECLNDDTLTQIREIDKSVGQRNICATSPYIEFFTYPKFTRFEFMRSEGHSDCEKFLTELKNGVMSAGWSTIDMS